MPARQPAPSKRSRVRRLPAQASCERADIHAIVDAAYVCHVAFADDPQELARDVWSGVLPFVQSRLPPRPEDGCTPGMPAEPLWWGAAN